MVITVQKPLNGIRAYVYHCSDLVEGLSPRLIKFQTEQAASRERHDTQKVPLECREKNLSNVITDVSLAADRASVSIDALSRGQVPALEEKQPIGLLDVEDHVKIWDLPRTLAESSLYQHDPTSGVIVEGWL